MKRALLASTGALLLAGCVGSSSEKHDSKQAAERLKSMILDEAPSDIGTHLDVNFEDKVSLLGVRVDPLRDARTNERVKIALFWQVKTALAPGYKLFTHVVDGSGERILNIDNVGPLREAHSGEQALPPSDWLPGKVYVDEQIFTLPGTIKTDKIQILTGIWKGDERLKIKSGPHDSTNRAIVATLTVNGRGAAARLSHVPTLRVDKLAPGVKPKLDGKLDDVAWQGAAGTGPLVDVRTGDPNQVFPINGEVKLAWNDDGIFVGFSVADTDLVGGFKKGTKDPHLWTRDTVEMMVDPDGDGDNKDYYEIQINPQNLVFDTQYDEYNKPKTEPDGPFGHEDWSSNVQSAVTLDGTVDKSDDEDRGYTVEAFVPWKSFGKAKQLPPTIGTSWRINFYAMKNNGGVSWSPILGQGNFHKASRFGRVLWADKSYVVPAEADSAAPPTSSSAPPAVSAAPALSASAAPSAKPAAVKAPPPKLAAPKPSAPASAAAPSAP